MTGFVGSFVGFRVGFLDVPDERSPFAAKDLDAICRVCRVFTTGESPGGIGLAISLPGGLE